MGFVSKGFATVHTALSREMFCHEYGGKRNRKAKNKRSCSRGISVTKSLVDIKMFYM